MPAPANVSRARIERKAALEAENIARALRGS